MATNSPLVIGYGGSLAAFDPAVKVKSLPFFISWVWTWRVNNIDASTRSGYFLFKALEFGIKNNYFSSDQIQVRLWGLIDKKNEAQVRKFGLEGIVRIEGYVNRPESEERLRACDVLFLPLESGTATQPTLFIPGKLFEYLSIAKPVLCFTRGGDCADILQKSGLGIITDPKDIPGAAIVLRDLVNKKREGKMYLKADQEYINQFNFRKLTGKLAAIFDQMLK